MADQITVSIATQYGKERICPVCDDAKLFCDIAGTKTLTRAHIEKIKALGYTVKVVSEVTSL